MESFELIKKFWEFNNREPIGHSTVSVYLLLIDVWDNEDKSDFTISDNQISKMLKLSRKTIKTAKDNLRNLGLISYKYREGFPCIYKIITDYEFVSEPILTKKKAQEQIKFETTAPQSEKQQPQKRTEQKDNVNPKVETVIPTVDLPDNVPTEQEFLEFAKSLEIYDAQSPNIDFKIKTKYETWKEAGWKNGHGKPIKNWKTTLKASLPYMLTPTSAFSGNVPKINRPKSTYNE